MQYRPQILCNTTAWDSESDRLTRLTKLHQTKSNRVCAVCFAHSLAIQVESNLYQNKWRQSVNFTVPSCIITVRAFSQTLSAQFAIGKHGKWSYQQHSYLPTQLSGNRRRVVNKDCPPVPVARTPTSYEPSESSPGRLTLDAVVLAVVSRQFELPSFLHSTSNVW